MSAAAVRNATWFAYFPDNYRWSFNVLLVLATARAGGAEIGEVDMVARRLATDVGNDELWFDEWVREGDRIRELAETALDRGHRQSAASHFRRACTYYMIGEHFRVPKDRRANEAYKLQMECFAHAVDLIDRPRVEPVLVPFEHGVSLPGYLVHPELRSGAALPPVVVYFDGFDGNKELSYLLGVEDLVSRGLACLVMDSPGIGAPLRFDDLYVRHDYEVPAGAVIDYLETRSDIDPARIGVMGMSLGGYYAPRAASREHRFAACAAWGGIWDYHARWVRRIEQALDARLPVPAEHLRSCTGASTTDEALRKIEGFKLSGVVTDMRCPFLLCHGEDDQQVPVDDARKLFEEVGSADKTLRVFTASEGGAQHCQIDNLSIGSAVVFDWLADRLGAA